MNSRKRISLLTMGILVVVFLSFNLTTFAVESSDNQSLGYVCTVKNDKIESAKVLKDRAINGVNDAPEQVVEEIEKNAVLTIDGVKQDEKPLVTTELLSEYSDGDDTVDNYAATVLSEMNIEKDELKATAASDYSKKESEKSSGGEITLTTTIYFTVKEVNGVGTIALNKVKVYGTVNTARVKIEYVKARYGYRGINFTTRKMDNVTSSWSKATGTTKTVTVNGPKLECVDGGMVYRIWGEGLAHVKRGESSTWDTKHTVEESGMGWFM